MCGGVTEKGPIKQVNQDAYLVKRAETPWGDVALAVVADGMGGLARGQVASAAVVRAFDGWFQRDLPLLAESLGAQGSAFERTLRIQWANLVQEVNMSLMQKGAHEGASMGAACTAVLVAAGALYALQVGDTRLYELADGQLVQLTRDQTFVAREMAAGRLTPEEAEAHPQGNVLLQCVGASSHLEPTFLRRAFNASAAYVVCSDGFRRSLTASEISVALAPALLDCQAALKTQISSLMEAAYLRGQRDNATAVIVRACGESEA